MSRSRQITFVEEYFAQGFIKDVEEPIHSNCLADAEQQNAKAQRRKDAKRFLSTNRHAPLSPEKPLRVRRLVTDNISLATGWPGQLDLCAMPASGSLPAQKRPGLAAVSPGRGSLRHARARLGGALRTGVRILAPGRAARRRTVPRLWRLTVRFRETLVPELPQRSIAAMELPPKMLLPVLPSEARPPLCRARRRRGSG